MTDTMTRRVAAQLRLPHTSTSRFAALDGYRAVAATMVVVYHVAGSQLMTFTPDLRSRILNGFGNFGVTIFFLLSGFLLFRPYVAAILGDTPSPSLRRYAVNRLTRIYPAYWLALTAALVFIAHTRVTAFDVPLTFGQYVELYSLWPLNNPEMPFSGLGVAWTLRIELMFYLVLPLLAWLYRAAARSVRTERARMGVVLAALGLTYGGAWLFRVGIVANQNPLLDSGSLLIPNFLDWFALGMLLATLVAWRDRGHRLPGLLEGAASSTVLCWCYAIPLYIVLIYNNPDNGINESTAQMYGRFFVSGLTAFALLLPATVGRNRRDPLHRVLASPPMLFLGTVSYGIYLWHTVVKDWIEGSSWWTEGGGHGFWPLLLLVYAVTVAVATVSWVLLESPVLRAKDQWLGGPLRRRAAVPAGPDRMPVDPTAAAAEGAPDVGSRPLARTPDVAPVAHHASEPTTHAEAEPVAAAGPVTGVDLLAPPEPAPEVDPRPGPGTVHEAAPAAPGGFGWRRPHERPGREGPDLPS